MDEEIHKEYVGVTNTLILENLKKLLIYAVLVMYTIYQLWKGQPPWLSIH